MIISSHTPMTILFLSFLKNAEFKFPKCSFRTNFGMVVKMVIGVRGWCKCSFFFVRRDSNCCIASTLFLF